MIKNTILGAIIILQLTACATATRGTTTLLVVNTVPSGAKVISSKETMESRSIGYDKRKKALQEGKNSDLQFEYIGCDPTPCGMEVPRKARFEVLVTKDGYEPQIFFIDRIHRKDVANNNSKKAALSTGAAAGAGAASAMATGASIGGASLVGPIAVFVALPVAIVGGSSIIIDASSGANFDLTPNPVDTTLVPTTESDNPKEDIEALVEGFYKRRRQISLNNGPTELQAKKIKKCPESKKKSTPCTRRNKYKSAY